ncbi:hypothetical protein BTHE_1907 [Bifidobacterium thermophilum]|nr:hypothetical protein BTHE_1907 [Bifidobacterium thermophilum]
MRWRWPPSASADPSSVAGGASVSSGAGVSSGGVVQAPSAGSPSPSGSPVCVWFAVGVGWLGAERFVVVACGYA